MLLSTIVSHMPISAISGRPLACTIKNSIYSSNPSVNLGTWLIFLISVWRCQVSELAENVDERLNIYHIWRNSTLQTCSCPLSKIFGICDQACKNQPCECKLHQVIFLLIFFVLNVVYPISVNFRRKPIKFCSSGRDFIVFA